MEEPNISPSYPNLKHSKDYLKKLWPLSPDLIHLNHGSFGSCPLKVLSKQTELRSEIEKDPTGFFFDIYPNLWHDAIERLASFLKADPDGLTFQSNATTGVNTVLRNLRLNPGDEILVFDHIYQACRNAVEATCARDGARMRVMSLPFPPGGEYEIVESALAHTSHRTKLAMFDTITSPTALRLPFERLIAEFQGRGIDVLLDASHGPGAVELNLDELDAAYVVGTCHKWLYTPKGSGFLYVRNDRRTGLEPLIVSHGYSAPVSGVAKFRAQFDWPGTQDPTPWLTIPTAIEFIDDEFPCGWEGVLKHNRQLAQFAYDALADLTSPANRLPASMIGPMASVVLAPHHKSSAYAGFQSDPLAQRLLDQCGIRVMIFDWPSHQSRYLRVSAAPYNSEADYRYLAECLSKFMG